MNIQDRVGAPTSATGPARAARVPLGDRKRLAAVALWLGVPLAIMLLSWHTLALEPTLKPGLGSSFEAGLHMALHEGVTFGNHLIFTYGPLGFLGAPSLWYGDTGTIAVLYTVILRFALALAVFLAARRSYGTLVAIVVALLVADASPNGTQLALETVPFLVLCVVIVDRVGATRQRLALMAAAGSLAGIELLNKISVGFEMTVLAVIVAVAARGRRRDNLLVTLAALIIGLLVGWTASGQDLGSLPAYVRNAVQIVLGYSAAMSNEEPWLRWQFVAGMLAFAIGLFGALQMTADGPPRRRWGIVALWVAFCLFEYKEGFARHEIPHGVIFFDSLAGAFIALRWRPDRRSRAIGLSLTAILLIFAFEADQTGEYNAFNLGSNASSAITQLRQVSSPSESAAITARGRRAIQREYPIDQRTLALLRGHTVHVEPYQAAIVWAYHLAWRPLPVFQSYAAYTTTLDRENADAVDSTRAPQRILRDRDVDFDERVQVFDDGLTARAILCRYQELRTTDEWQVLAPGPNRCGTPVPLGTVHAAWGQRVLVPAPPNDHSFVYVRIGGAVAVGGFERLVSLLYKPAEREVGLGGRGTRFHRLIEGTAADGLILRAPAQVDFTAPFNLAANSTRIAVEKAGQGLVEGKPLTFSFFAQPVSRGPQLSAPSTDARANATALTPRSRD